MGFKLGRKIFGKFAKINLRTSTKQNKVALFLPVSTVNVQCLYLAEFTCIYIGIKHYIYIGIKRYIYISIKHYIYIGIKHYTWE